MQTLENMGFRGHHLTYCLIFHWNFKPTFLILTQVTFSTMNVHLTTETYLVGIADSPDSPDDEEMVSYLRQIQVNHYAPYYTLY